DLLNRRTQVIEAANQDSLRRTTTTMYDAAGNVIAVIDPYQRTTQTWFDALNRPVQVTGPLQDTTNKVYDTWDNLVYTIDPLHFVTSYGYDALGRRVLEVSPFGKFKGLTMDAFDATIQRRTTFQFDAQDNVRFVVRPSGLADPPTTRAAF